MTNKNNLETQYDSVSEKYFFETNKMNEISNEDFKSHLNIVLSQKPQVIADLGCGPGELVLHLKSLGHCPIGIDSSNEMVLAARKVTGCDIRNESFSQTSIADNSCDVVVSKWAMQTTQEIDPIYQEVVRIIKKNGYFVFLVVHPLRQFLEKKKDGKDYFQKEIVYSEIFDRSITVQEPSHTLMEYFSTYFLSNFLILAMSERAEFPAAEQLGGDTYPTYLLVVAQKK